MPRLLTNRAPEHGLSQNWIAGLRAAVALVSATNGGTDAGARLARRRGALPNRKALTSRDFCDYQKYEGALDGLPIVEGVSLLVLLVAVANVMNLQLSRAAQ